LIRANLSRRLHINGDILAAGRSIIRAPNVSFMTLNVPLGTPIYCERGIARRLLRDSNKSEIGGKAESRQSMLETALLAHFSAYDGVDLRAHPSEPPVHTLPRMAVRPLA
jgi:hypothetical protein